MFKKKAIVSLVVFAFGVHFTGCSKENMELAASVYNSLTHDQELSLDTVVAGLKDALKVGTQRTVETLSADGGYAQNPALRIPLPDEFTKIGDTLRTIGLGAQVDQIEAKMNEAAEKAAKQALPIFGDAITKMSFEDAKALLFGDSKTAVTDFFKKTTSTELKAKYMPEVTQKMEEIGLVKSYNSVVSKYNAIPFVPKFEYSIESYVSDMALKGLFETLGEEEEKIRENPAQRSTELLQKVFGRADQEKQK